MKRLTLLLVTICLISFAGCSTQGASSDYTQLELGLEEVQQDLVAAEKRIAELIEELEQTSTEEIAHEQKIIDLQGQLDLAISEKSKLEKELLEAIVSLEIIKSELEMMIKAKEEFAEDPDITSSAGGELKIYNLMVEFADYNSSTIRAGAFAFYSNEDKVFLEFGAVVDKGKILPTFEYRTANDAKVFAVTHSVVSNVIYQSENDDYEICTHPLYIETGITDYEYLITYDHVNDVHVVVGDILEPGRLVGTVGTWNTNLGRTD